MLSKRPIRVKFSVGLGLLILLVAILSGSGLHSNYAYRGLVKSLSWRAVELPLAGQLSRQVGDLRIALGELRGFNDGAFPHAGSDDVPIRVRMFRDLFRAGLDDIDRTLTEYGSLLDRKVLDGLPIADNQQEHETLRKIEAALTQVREANRDEDWMLGDINIDLLDEELSTLQVLAAELPSHLHDKLLGFRDEAKISYRALIAATWMASLAAGLIFLLFVMLFYRWVFRPLQILIDGSRRVASGRFNYRIHLKTSDEMSELADAMNRMTARFRDIRDDLDRQVQERTRQVVRSEQLASVGFLAAGVAHEINNPLAAIAMSAESLESRLAEIFDETKQDHAVVADYLRMIQSEAFRCKEITEQLLDFSRIGPVHRQPTELGQLVAGVVEMVGLLGKYQTKNVRVEQVAPVIAPVQPQEMKQIVLNLLTNALDSLDDQGTVLIRVGRNEETAEVAFIDDGCGIEPAVLEHIFEPFFTRRRGGDGTGLGLSIAYRIAADHGGDIKAESAGRNRGSTLRVRLPLFEYQKENENQYRDAPPTQTAVC